MPRWLAILLALAVAQLAFGKEVTLEMPNRLIARADYQIGAADKPVVLILHGFLQTHDFHTAHNMADGLHDLGYNVLAPTLTLGVPYRNQSLACEAIHGHSLEDDEAEIGVWLDWLEARHQGPIILLGHSTGSVELLAYLSQHRDPRIKKLIGASIIEGALTGGEQVRSEMIADLKQRIGAKKQHPGQPPVFLLQSLHQHTEGSAFLSTLVTQTYYRHGPSNRHTDHLHHGRRRPAFGNRLDRSTAQDWEKDPGHRGRRSFSRWPV